jgi:acetolactate decarboxylase
MMRARFLLPLLVALLLALPARADDEVWQYSTIAALLAGTYQGALTVGELKTHGDLGLGTFNGLDGEMVVLDGKVWQVRTDGRPAEAGDGVGVPFAAVIRFAARRTLDVPAGLDMAGLTALLDTSVADPTLIQAVRIDGRFTRLKVRSVPAQTPPYRPLTAIVPSEQTVFDLSEVEGTLVGFRFPSDLAGANVVGWHLHFIAADRRAGGHVLGLTTGPARAALDTAARLTVQLLPGARLGKTAEDPAVRAVETAPGAAN